jgi:diguanylate cyclase (GGDEF)-like protein
VKGLLNFVEGRGRTFAMACGVAVVATFGVLDYFTGFEISFAFFYLIPVALVTWTAGLRAGVLFSFGCAVTWHAANSLAGETFSNPFVPYWNAATRLGFFLVVAYLLARLRESLGHERDMARTDFLTGAVNARAFYELAEMEINRLRRYGHPFTLAYMDADNFKAVNDRLGHSAGDRLLVSVVAVARRSLRSTDVVARLGGDEFAVLMPETDVGQGRAAAGKLRGRLLEEMRRHGWPVTFSVGVLTCTDPPRDVDELIGRADALMYEVKKAGKDALRHSGAGDGVL